MVTFQSKQHNYEQTIFKCKKDCLRSIYSVLSKALSEKAILYFLELQNFESYSKSTAVTIY